MSEQTVKQEGEFKLKKRKTPKKLATPENNVTKVSMKEPLIETEPDITKVVIKKETDAIQTQATDDSDVIVKKPENSSNGEAVVKEIRESEEEVDSPIQLVSEDDNEEADKVTTEYKEAVRDEKVLGKPLPENIEKLVNFMEETGGDINDYVRLNADYSNIDNETLLKEYYKQTKPAPTRD